MEFKLSDFDEPINIGDKVAINIFDYQNNHHIRKKFEVVSIENMIVFCVEINQKKQVIDDKELIKEKIIDLIKKL